ncbi:hypothetical protein [Kingella potus]|uniref:hypothetical protein n=1 Tax=Kingella potus TaxID=265175 RepID=UPI001FD06DB7|nr:hypothetical protein [Kingella potus]UOP01044.1 hypothetical protein LVJ84_01325 [Kingella potus]
MGRDVGVFHGAGFGMDVCFSDGLYGVWRPSENIWRGNTGKPQIVVLPRYKAVFFKDVFSDGRHVF